MAIAQRSLSHRLLLCVSTLCFVSQVAAQPTPALDFSSLGSGFNYSQGSYSLGWSFSTTQSVSVSALGFYDDLADGLSASHEVGIFDAVNCTLLTSTTVTPADPLTGFFRYHNILPITLPAGGQFFIAAVTGNEKYAVGVSTLTMHPAVTFGGFAIYGNTEPSTTLRCPNGSASLPGFRGDFGPSFLIGGSGAAGNKRATGIRIFCNRVGVNLETADCTVTVGDAGPPPRTLPTGAVEFTATSGFVPASAQCFITQTPFSPGVGACNAQFAIPFGFGIGVPFPIDALYPGDATFAPSATSHALIKAACIKLKPGDTCVKAEAKFKGYPQTVKTTVNVILACGDPSIGENNGPSCNFRGGALLSITQLIKQLAYADWIALSGLISPQKARTDAFLFYAKEIGKLPNDKFEKLIGNAAGLAKIEADVARNRIPRLNEGSPFVTYIPLAKADASAAALTRGTRPSYKLLATRGAGRSTRKKDQVLGLKPIDATVKPNTTKAVNFTFRRRLKLIAPFLEQAEVPTMPITIDLKVKQKGSGAAQIKESVDVGLN